MSSDISARAEISPKAKIGDGCKIFPFVYIEDDVVIGDNCIVFPFVSILNGTRIGNGNKIHQGSVIGALPQDFNFVGEKSELIMGDNNIIRENVVINRATHRGCQTVIGSNNFLMEGAHISHDTKLGDNCVLGYGVKISGDCEIGNRSSSRRVSFRKHKPASERLQLFRQARPSGRDIPPYIVAGGSPVKYNGLNSMMCDTLGIDEKREEAYCKCLPLDFSWTDIYFRCLHSGHTTGT